MAAQTVFEFASSGGKKAAQQIGSVNKSLSSMLNITKSFKKTPMFDKPQQNLVQQYKAQIKTTEDQVSALQKQMKQAGNIDTFRDLKTQLDDAKSELDKLNDELKT